MPKVYTPRARPNPWTSSQKGLLVSLRAANRPWPEIAQRCGRTKASCQTMMSYIRNGRVKENGEIAIEPMKVAPPVFIAVQALPAPVATGRHLRTSTLIMDAELRARIAIQGPNGLFGDPLPGRSALDAKRGVSA